MRFDGDLQVDGEVTVEGVRLPVQNTDSAVANRIFSGTAAPASPRVGDVWVTGEEAPASSPLGTAGNLVTATYMTTAVSGVASDGWYFDNAGARQLVDFTGRTCSIMWQGTPGQIPAQGTAADAFRTGDLAAVRSATL